MTALLIAGLIVAGVPTVTLAMVGGGYVVSARRVDDNLAHLGDADDLMAVADAVQDVPARLCLSRSDRVWLRRCGLDLDATAGAS